MTDKPTPLFDLESAFLDIDAIDGGKWMPIGAEYPGVEILARGLSSPDAKKLRQHLERTAPREDRLANGQLTDDARDNIVRLVVARKCVLDWRGVVMGGKSVPFSVTTLEGLMQEPRARRIAAAFVNAIVDLEQTTMSAQAAVEGN
jgi:hypothetical protein